ncbi:hypothetical protein [Amphibacillus jilinensis]|uniref:hypothetical protein n=1 Tax=Amphibacillus jilinensis TaxID=1216008 RepID=UPI00030D17F3|nr:hypothetical protein [Amphibacillus jilinensis]
MWKNVWVVFIIFLLSACQSNEDSNSSGVLPEQVQVGFDLESVVEYAEAAEYKADFIDLDIDIVAAQLLDGKIVEQLIYAMGPQYIAEGDGVIEYLITYDGGDAFGEYGGLDGGLSYSRSEKDRFPNYDAVVFSDPGPPNQTAQLSSYYNNEDFQTFTDLDFSPYLDVEQIIVEQLADLGLKDLQMDMVYALDLDTMQEHYTHYLLGEQREEEWFEWNKSEEAYLMHFRQVIDDIPLMNAIWQDLPIEEGEATQTEITAIYNDGGFNSLEVRRYYKTIEKSSMKPLISRQDAMDKLIELYQFSIVEKETIISDLTLNYVAVVDDEQYRLIPAWVFEVKTKETFSSMESYYDYRFYVFNAMTGERIKRAGEVS